MLEGKEDFFTPEELENGDYKKTKLIDDLYLVALKKNPQIKELIHTYDEPLLKCLRHIELTTFKENDAFTLVFYFDENEYLENSKINVSVLCNENGDSTEIKCDPLQWKEGKNITEKKIVKKQKNKRTGQQREVVKTEKQPSFFQLFESVHNHLL